MLLTLLAVVATIGSPIEDYCPMTPGTRWTYQDENGVQIIDEIGSSIDIGGGKKAIAKTTKRGGLASTDLFVISGDALQLVGFIADTPKKEISLLSSPQTIVRIGEKKLEWEFLGEIATGVGPIAQKIRGSSSPGGKKTVLGREVETVTARIVSKVGNDQRPIEVSQVMVYGKGIGLIELSSTTKAQGKTVRNLLKLVKFEPVEG